MPTPTDRPAIADLLARTGHETSAEELDRMLRFDPRRRMVLCAGSWIGSTRMVVGLAAVDRVPGTRPDVMVADERLAPGIRGLLGAILAADTAARGRFAA